MRRIRKERRKKRTRLRNAELLVRGREKGLIRNWTPRLIQKLQMKRTLVMKKKRRTVRFLKYSHSVICESFAFSVLSRTKRKSGKSSLRKIFPKKASFCQL